MPSKLLFPILLAVPLNSQSLHASSHYRGSDRMALAYADPVPAQVAVCFVPAESCVSEVVAAIRKARSRIRVQAYGFTSVPILKALIEAKHAGVDVQVILDKSNEQPRYTGATTMQNADIPVWIDTTVAIAHNKTIIIDDHLVVGGSYNYTTSSEQRNAENVTFIESSTIADWYRDNWESRKAVSKIYDRPQTQTDSAAMDRAG
jgi:phospholipase D